MPRSKQSDRRSLAKLRAELHATPWAIETRAFGAISAAIEDGDIESVQATLALGKPDDTATKVRGGVAIIPVTGVLRDEVDYMVRFGGASSYQLIEQEITQSLQNAQVSAVLLYIDSPGGSAVGCKRVADAIFAARGDKPIVAFAQGMAGSAAYYIASACDRIEATADAMVGSVGTIYSHEEYSGAYKEYGIGATVFTNSDSPKKGHGNPYEPLSDEARKTLQDFVNSYGTSFVNDVARYRGVNPEEVVAKYGQGDSMRADAAVDLGVIDAVVANFSETLGSLTKNAGVQSLPANSASNGVTHRSNQMNERIKAQLFALGLIDSIEASDAECKAALTAWCKSRGEDVPSDESHRLSLLQSAPKSEKADSEPEDEGDDSGEGDEDDDKPTSRSNRPAKNVKQAHEAEMSEARLADLRAARDLINETAGYDAISADMVLDAAGQKLDAKGAMQAWKAKLADNESPLEGRRVKVTESANQYAADVVDALVYRASDNRDLKLSANAEKLVNRPLWAVAGECLKLAGQDVDMYSGRELLAEEAMQMGAAHQRHTFFSSSEDRRYIQASGTPTARPGDFPNILSALANKFLDTVQLDDDYSYPEISATMPGGLNDFKPAMMMNKGIVEELDELQDAEQFKDLGLEEEVLSYIFLRRFGNKWGWTPVLVANDDMNAFAEGMLGMAEAWQVTQNRLVLDRYTANESLLDGNPLFANRADFQTATNNNDVTSGAAPSDTSWGEMETAYADIGGINTGRRVRGVLNVALVPTGAVWQEARRTFMPLNAGGLEGKVADTTANVGLYRGQVKVVPESELRTNSAAQWYGLRNPTRLNTATVVRAYFNGFGTEGRRERWYDPSTKTTYVSIEGRIATAVKNWRYAIRNAGSGG